MPSFVSKISLRLPPGSSIANQLNHDLIEHLPVAIYLCDQFGVLVAYNRKAAEIWGDAPNLGDSQLKFCGAYKLLTPEGVHVPHELTPLAQVLVTKQAVINFRTIIERRDGSRVPVLANITPLFDDTGVMVGFMNAVQDQRFQESQANERALLKDALFQSQKMETIGQLTSGLAHDFNNQLSSVVMAVNLMKKEIEDIASEKLLRRLHLAEQAIERATTLADSLLRFARHRPRDLTIVSPNEIIQSMEELFQTAIGSSSEINLQLDSTIWNIKTNIAQLESSLLNIAINARDAGSGGIHLNISTENVVLEPFLHQGEGHSGREHVRISVSDNGCGMSEDMIDKIFTPFFTTKEAGKGTGLGLAMVKGFVSDMDGELKVESVVGQGTTMHLYFPRAEML
jgi:signal transduction histidine kinase